MAVYNMYKCIHTNKNKRDGFSSILSVERPTVYTNNPPCASPLRRHVHTNYYYFSPNHTHKTKANSPSTSSPWNTRKGFFLFFFFSLTFTNLHSGFSDGTQGSTCTFRLGNIFACARKVPKCRDLSYFNSCSIHLSIHRQVFNLPSYPVNYVDVR